MFFSWQQEKSGDLHAHTDIKKGELSKDISEKWYPRPGTFSETQDLGLILRVRPSTRDRRP